MHDIFTMKRGINISIILLLLLTSCTEYNQLLKSTDYDLKKAKALEYYYAGKYAKSAELLEQVLPRFRVTGEAEELSWMNAQSYYGMKDYYSAVVAFKNNVELYPYGTYAEESMYMAAMCNYNISPRAELDQDYTTTAIEDFGVFIARYPNSGRLEECKRLKKELEERLVEKSYLSAKLYYDLEEYKAAIVALGNSLKEYSESKYREEMLFLKLNSHFMYAEKSVSSKQLERYQETLDEYYAFHEEFPTGKYSKDAEKIYQSTGKYLKQRGIDLENRTIADE